MEYDYRLKQIDSAMHVKMDCYREACKVVSKAKDLVYEVSREAHNEDNKSDAFYLSTKKMRHFVLGILSDAKTACLLQNVCLCAVGVFQQQAKTGEERR